MNEKLYLDEKKLCTAPLKSTLDIHMRQKSARPWQIGHATRVVGRADSVAAAAAAAAPSPAPAPALLVTPVSPTPSLGAAVSVAAAAAPAPAPAPSSRVRRYSAQAASKSSVDSHSWQSPRPSQIRHARIFLPFASPAAENAANAALSGPGPLAKLIFRSIAKISVLRPICTLAYCATIVY